MVNTSILSGVALATLINVVVVTASKKLSSLDTTVWTANDTNLIPEEEFNFDQGSSIAERKKCLATRKCTNAGGSCIESRAYCDGTVNRQGCKGKKCKYCIPNQTTTISPSTFTTLPIQDTTTTTDQTTTISPSTFTTLPTQDTTTTTGFEVFHGRVIRYTISSDTKSNWDTAMSFCNQFGANPFIPRTVADYKLYKRVMRAIVSGDIKMWLPANDRLQEGTLRWYNGEVASNI